METLEGNVERITYYNSETGYCVMRIVPNQLRLGKRDQLITVVGTMPELQPGEQVKIDGTWMNHPVHGLQFKSDTLVQLRPATLEGIRRYLGSGLIKGVGKRYAARIVDFFGMDTLDVLDNNPQRLLEVPGVGRKLMDKVAKAWVEQREIKRVMLFLQGHNINTALALRIYKTYGDDSLEIVQQDPYQMVRDVVGIGFITADKIARDMGLPAFAPTRIRAGLVYALNEATDDGHVFLPTQTLIEQAAEFLDVEAPLLENELTRLEDEGEIFLQDLPHPETQAPMQVVYHSVMYRSEKGAAERLRELLDAPKNRLDRLTRMNSDEWRHLIHSITSADGIRLTEQQSKAVQTALTSKCSILTGGPGTGKTTTLRTIIAVLQSTRHSFKLASPTGRAAKRLAEATGQPAQTIHRMLDYSPQDGFGYNRDNPLDTDIVVVDESSMIDLVLFYSLLRAIGPETHLLLVGDVDQLPSVGAGDVLRDLIRSHAFPTIRLDTVFRQAGDSLIIENAYRINQGQQPDTSNKSSDFFFFNEEDPPAAAELLVDVVCNRVPQRFGFDAMRDIQVLAPMYNGQIGVTALNNALQEKLNPPGRPVEKRIAGTLFRAGDKVMQTRNNYEKEVYNGDIGIVRSIDLVEHLLDVEIDGRLVTYDWLETPELVHAYAISVHKSQGAEYPVVIMPIMTQHFMMLQRNLLYTAVTRAKKMVVLVGSRKALAIAVKNNQVNQRWTALDWRLFN
ncbi:MAG: ATP-dependent RecD-like DNA helicase [Anaerolineales bacterium]|nr:ATP-dependent RecD-like DNA helicase [Anaerolineales bacterium]